MRSIEEVCADIQVPDEGCAVRVKARLDQLTKPPGSLGRLEELAIRLGALQGSERPRVKRKLMVVMAADHGVCRNGVSAYPQEVTGQMVANFLRDGAAISVLARQFGVPVLVVDMGVAYPVKLEAAPDRFRDCRLGPGTHDLLEGEAMAAEEARRAVETGMALAEEQAAAGVDVLAGGEMGIGNTTASSVLTALVTGSAAEVVAGPGSGVTGESMRRKQDVVRRAVERHAGWSDGLDLLRRCGGFEIGGLAGLMLGAASRRIPFIVDGFIATAAALVAAQLAPAVRPYLIAAHRSQEPGHGIALEHLELIPFLDLGLRLGEGTGAAMLFPLLDAAMAVLDGMATFASAGVSGGPL